jgi:hypothetical protein
MIKKERPSWVWLPVSVVVAIWLGLFMFPYINPDARDGRAILHKLSNQDITFISIEPARRGRPSSVKEPLIIRDRKAIAAIVDALSSMSRRSPEHPQVTQAVVLSIHMEGRVIGGYLEESSNDGTTFYYMSKINTGWVFGTYRIPKGERIFDLISKAIKGGEVAPETSSYVQFHGA